MKSVPLKAFPRSLGRRAGAKKLRATGRIPAVIYGRQSQPQNLEVSAREMKDLIHHSLSENLLVDLAVKDDAKPKRLALVQQVQHHPLSGDVLHVDFHEVSENEKVVVMVPVETVGEAAGVKTGGGVLEHVLFKLKVRGLPKDVPEQIIIDVTSLELGRAIHIGEITPPANVEILGGKNIPVVAVAMPRTEEEEAAAAAEGAVAAGDVEMIKEKKEGEEEGAAPAGKGAEKGAAKGAAPEKGAAPAAKGAAPAAKGAAPAAEKAGAWRICISSWAWEIRAPITRRRGTTPASGWSRNWPRAGGRTGLWKRSSTRGWRGPNGTRAGCSCASRRRS
jgi:large subunit ribosomal protein L25